MTRDDDDECSLYLKFVSYFNIHTHYSIDVCCFENLVCHLLHMITSEEVSTSNIHKETVSNFKHLSAWIICYIYISPNIHGAVPTSKSYNDGFTYRFPLLLVHLK